MVILPVPAYHADVAPVRERGLKFEVVKKQSLRNKKVAPVRERGLKSQACHNTADTLLVAPVRERGLK